MEYEIMTDTKHIPNKSSSTHTPGPWTPCFTIYDGAKTSFHIAAFPHGSCKPVAECAQPLSTMIDHWTSAEIEANAHLIAAAPELLNSLQEVVRICEEMRYIVGLGKNQLERIERAKSVIAEAKGLAA
jgi:hypothetical protein